MINADMTLAQIQAYSPEMALLEPWFFTHKFPGTGTLRQCFGPGAEYMAHALNLCGQRLEAGEPVFHDLYTPEEIVQDPAKGSTKLLYTPGKPGAPFVVVIPGGAYRNVCSLVEGFPTAQLFADQGYNAFILYYQVDRPNLLPAPMDDLARAIQMIRANADFFQVNPDRYGVIGFSAGGHLAASWGTDNHGYLHYGLPKPEMLFLGYPAVSSEIFFETGNIADASFFLETWCKPITQKGCQEYCAELHSSTNYPPVYIVHSKDDPQVPWVISQALADTLKCIGIPCHFQLIESGGHGFALGVGTDADGWVLRAIDFWKSCSY